MYNKTREHVANFPIHLFERGVAATAQSFGVNTGQDLLCLEMCRYGCRPAGRDGGPLTLLRGSTQGGGQR